MNSPKKVLSQSDEDKLAKMSQFMKQVLFDAAKYNDGQSQEVIEKTPRRFCKYLLEVTEGYNINLEEIVSDALFDANNFEEMLIIRDISFTSTCEHHLLPYFGTCTIGCLPGEKLLGLSKYPRFVDAISKKLSLQENLTKEIAETLDKFIKSRGLVVIITAKHSCMCFRGIKSYNSDTQTIYRTGKFKEQDSLDTFFKLLKSGN